MTEISGKGTNSLTEAELQERWRRVRVQNRVLGLGLAVVCVLLFMVTFVRLGTTG